MKTQPSVVDDNAAEINELIETWITVEQRLVELTGGEVDSVVSQSGRTLLFSRAQEQLRAQDVVKQANTLNELRVLFDLVPAMIWFKDTKNRFLRVNQRVAESTGLSVEEIEGKSAYDLFPDEAEGYFQDDQKVIQSKTSKLGIVEKLRGPNNRDLWVQTDKVPVIDNKGKVIGLVAMVQDVTERIEIESALRDSEERFREMLNNVELLAMILNLDGKVTFCNDFLLRVAGWDRAEVLGNDWFSMFVSPADQEALKEAFHTVTSETIMPRYETTIVTRTGQKRDIVWNSSLLKDASGNLVGLANIGEDVTERKSLQEQLLQSQKMESLGSLAGGIAHDFNNLLTGMLGYTELIQMDLPSDSPAQADLEEIRKSAVQAAKMTKQLLSFARKDVVEQQVLDLNDLVSNLESMTRRLLGVDIQLVVRLLPELGNVKLDPSQFEQLVLNLSVNARDAMPNGGSLVIATSNIVVDQVQETHGNSLQPGRYVLLTVSDDGCGIPKEVQARVFDPFFTTKEKGKGTGLGLSTCYGIVANSGGQIRVYSEVNVGTTFHIYFARVDEAPSPTIPVDETEALGRGETILLVEDEDTVRTIAEQILTTAGYRVLCASDGVAALKIVATHRQPIDLLLSDVIMPGMTGPELSEVLHKVRPEIKVLFMSGFADDAIIQERTLDRTFSFLQKPFSRTQLSQKVRLVLDKPVT